MQKHNFVMQANTENFLLINILTQSMDIVSQLVSCCASNNCSNRSNTKKVNFCAKANPFFSHTTNVM